MTPSSNPLPADPIASIIFWIDPEGRILDASDGACRALGHDREALRAMSVRDVDAEFPFDRWPDHWRELRQAKTLRFRTTRRRRDGSRFPVEVTAHHVELDGREYNCALVREITPQRKAETALRESEERLALALAVSGQGLYDLDIATGRTVFSDEYARMLGYEPSELELTPATWAGWLHPEERQEILQLFEDCMTGKRRDYRAEFRLHARSGEWIWVLSVGKIVRWDATGRPVRMVGTHLDITERKRTEAALLESEERFAKAFRASPAPMCITDIETGRFLDVNAQLLRMLDYTREQMIGHTSVELGAWADPGARERMIAQLRADGFFREMPTRFRTRTGEIRQALYSAEILQLGEQKVLLSLVYDITEKKRAEEALRVSEAFLDSVVTQSPLPILIFDTTGKIVRGNPAIRALFDPTAEHDFDENVIFERYNLFQDEQLREQGYATLIERVFRAGEAVRFVSRYDMTRLQFSSSALPPRYLDLDSTTFPVKDTDGNVTHAVTYHLDITDRKAAETRLRYHLELEQALAEISALMIKPGWEDFDARINWTLERIGRLTRADRSFLFLTTPDGLVASNTHEWCAPGIRSQIQDLQNLPVADYQPFYGLLQQQEVVEIQTARLPDDTTFKPILLEGGVRSLLCVSVNWGGTLRGFVGLDAVVAERTWREEDVRLLRVVAEIVAHTLQHIESERILRDNTRYLENLDRISRIFARRGRDADLLAELAAALLEIFQADRAFFLHPGDPDAARFHIRIEATRPEWPGVFASGAEITPDGVEIVPDDAFRDDLRRTLHRDGPTLSDFAGASEAPDLARRSGIRSQMTIALRPQLGPPWVLGVHQCADDRRWTDAEQRLFQAIAERVSDALSGHLLLQQLQESEQRYRTVFENAHDAIIVHDFQGAIQAVNQTMLTLFGLEYEEALKATIADLSGPDNLSNPANDHWPRVLRGEILHFEWNARRPKDGSCFPVEVLLRAIQFGGRNCILGDVRDITERKRAEAELERHREHLEDLVAERTAELRQAMTQLVQAEKLAALGHLVAGVAHELNTPLGNARVIAGSLGEHLHEFAAAVESGALRRSQLDAFLARGREAVAILERNAARAADLIGHFKQVAVDQTSMRRRRFFLRQTVEELLAALQPQFKQTAHRVELDIPPDIELDSYPGPLEQVLVNLVTNSLTHGFAGIEAGVICIKSRPFGPDQVQIDYTDDGAGISEKILKKIFDPFFTTKLGSGGSGLGLYIVYNLVTGFLGGTVQARSWPGQGVDFNLVLPRIAPDRPALETPA